ncbi:MAG: replicative DNA helicase [Aquamicrobium sp.]|uniref:replicative DNA helicase n=1 Tax=Aquamicrobium sp. TaxID=1872579 RepID=UPI00349ECBC0|nr:replicative DNA helicase [Aquamicrobium sp.]
MNAPLSIPGFVVEIEQDVLGSLLLTNDFRRVNGILRGEHFLEPLHAYLFQKMGDAFERYGTLNPVVVKKMLPEEEAQAWAARLGKTVGAYLAELATNTITAPGNMERSARKVVEQWARIKIGEEGTRLQAAAVDTAINAHELIGNLASRLDEIGADLRLGGPRRTRLSMQQAASAAIAEVEQAMANGSGMTGITWGLADINRATGGLHRGEMVIIGARPSMGKTAVAGSVALRAARAGAGVGFVSLEMSSSKIAMRALTDLAYDRNAKIAYSDLMTGRVDEATYDAIHWAQTELSGLPLIFEEQGGLTISELRAKIDRIVDDLKEMGKTLDVLVVDYLQLLRPSARYSGNRNNEISEISSSLRNFGREYNCAVIALSQLSRNVEGRDDKRPTLADLRDSGSIEQDADAVVFLYREAYYLEKAKGKDPDKEAERVSRLIDVANKLEFIIAKQRNGPVKTVDLFVDIACSAVRNAAVF